MSPVLVRSASFSCVVTSKKIGGYYFTAHDAEHWLHGHPTGFGRVAEALLGSGVMFDFVSDRLLVVAPAVMADFARG